MITHRFDINTNCLRYLQFFILLSTLPIYANQADTTKIEELEGVEIIGKHITSKIRRDSTGGMNINLSLLNNMPRIAGNADPIHYTQLLPSVQTNSELDAGLYIQGCSNAHNGISIDGVTIYDIQHLLGIFSVFNPSHFSNMKFSSSAFTAEATNRIGGFIDMARKDSLTKNIKGDLSVGLISSQGTLCFPIGKKSELVLSGRGAYINLLYSKWLQVEESTIKYSFYDANITWTYKPNHQNTFWVNYYSGNDNMYFQEGSYNYDSYIKWGNLMASINWEYRRDKLNLRQTAYITRYKNEFYIDKSNFKMYIPSSIYDYGYQLKLNKNRFSAGTEWIAHDIHPQQPKAEGEIQTKTISDLKQKSIEGTIWGDYRLALSPKAELLAGMRANLYKIEKNTFLSADPILSLLWTPRYGHFRLTANIKHQYLYRTGLSRINLPTDFWLSADDRNRPQYAYGVSTEYRTDLIPQLLQISVGLYYKHLYNQKEYIGTPFDLTFSDFNFNDNLINGEGDNYGLNLMIEKRTGKLTGWISYAWGRAFRHYHDTRLKGTFPASHERIHEFNAIAIWELNKKWSFGATLVWASGTPFTAPHYFYIQNGNLMTQYNEYNSNRLSTYIRLDLSATYKIKVKNGKESGINLSIYNASGRHNDLFWSLKTYKNKYQYSSFSATSENFPFLPSINYYIKF